MPGQCPGLALCLRQVCEPVHSLCPFRTLEGLFSETDICLCNLVECVCPALERQAPSMFKPGQQGLVKHTQTVALIGAGLVASSVVAAGALYITNTTPSEAASSSSPSRS